MSADTTGDATTARVISRKGLQRRWYAAPGLCARIAPIRPTELFSAIAFASVLDGPDLNGSCWLFGKEDSEVANS